MRVLFTSFPGNTHYFNSVPLAWALRAAGHEVRVASAPELTPAITGSGLTAVPVGSAETLQEKTLRSMRERDFRSVEQWMTRAIPSKLHLGQERADDLDWDELAWGYDGFVVPTAKIMNDSMVDELVDFARWWRPDLVLWDAVSYAGSLAAAACGAAHGRVLFSHDIDARTRNRYLALKAEQPEGERTDSMEEWLGGWAAKHRFPYSETLTTGDFTIDQLPESFRLETGLRYLSMRHIPYNGPSETPRWVWTDPAAPRVLMTFGLSSRTQAHLRVLSVAQVQDALDELAGLDIELIVTLPDEVGAQLDRIPENTRVVEFVPLHALLPTCSAVLHQAGPGGFNGSLRYAVPQLIVSLFPDAPIKARALQRAGAGLSIPPAQATGARIREAFERLLGDPSFREGAENLRQEVLRQPAPSEVVGDLEALAAEYGRRDAVVH
ncbi:activator-dependent family glycosyltransferase [Actinomadura graeca]|uniref:Activator-dependent family glycosyltransferase n=1 Tax=Actinomadura graeca TaxID=2750812 RepID=A0ABX8R5N8_9ACTN|nr:activator-dependent family glycosyltransferase [Actinomadura graeca]QXJ26143.1 activator-dependent family glycosyltransferase [Actinomadura graeca]